MHSEMFCVFQKNSFIKKSVEQIALFWNLALSLVLALYGYCRHTIKYRLLSKKTTIWRLKKSRNNDKPLEKITSSGFHMKQKKFIEASFIYKIHTGENIFAAAIFKGL